MMMWKRYLIAGVGLLAITSVSPPAEALSLRALGRNHKQTARHPKDSAARGRYKLSSLRRHLSQRSLRRKSAPEMTQPPRKPSRIRTYLSKKKREITSDSTFKMVKKRWDKGNIFQKTGVLMSIGLVGALRFGAHGGFGLAGGLIGGGALGIPGAIIGASVAVFLTEGLFQMMAGGYD
jgi:hypothetical protein